MITEKLIFKIPYEIPDVPDYSAIFGANYYDHWRAWDAGSLTLTGSLVDSAASLTGSGRSMDSPGSGRPTLNADSIIGKNAFQFDGVNEFMQVASSTTDYNFLHNGAGGCVIIVGYIDDVNPDNAQVFLDNHNLTTAETGFDIVFDDRSSSSRNNRVINRVSKSVGGQTPINNLSSDNVLLTQQYNNSTHIFDADNATAADRSVIVVNGGSEIKNNTNTFTPVLTSASNNLTLGRRTTTTDFHLKGSIAEVIIIDTIPTPTQLAQVQARLEFDYSTFPIT